MYILTDLVESITKDSGERYPKAMLWMVTLWVMGKRREEDDR